MATTSGRHAVNELFDIVFGDSIFRSPRFHLNPTVVGQLEYFRSAFGTSSPMPLSESISAPVGFNDWSIWRTDKMKFASGTGPLAIEYNRYIELSAVPEEAHTVRIGELTPVEWVVDRCQTVRDPRSGRVLFDPNDVSRRHKCPRLVADFLATTIAASSSIAHHR